MWSPISNNSLQNQKAINKQTRKNKAHFIYWFLQSIKNKNRVFFDG